MKRSFSISLIFVLLIMLFTVISFDQKGELSFQEKGSMTMTLADNLFLNTVQAYSTPEIVICGVVYKMEINEVLYAEEKYYNHIPFG